MIDLDTWGGLAIIFAVFFLGVLIGMLDYNNNDNIDWYVQGVEDGISYTQNRVEILDWNISSIGVSGDFWRFVGCTRFPENCRGAL